MNSLFLNQIIRKLKRLLVSFHFFPHPLFYTQSEKRLIKTLDISKKKKYRASFIIQYFFNHIIRNSDYVPVEFLTY